MQDIHSIAGGSRLFGGGAGDRRLRPHLHHHQNQQALKCPRCDSLNTKFCYYNNYNLSQPRHFCKSCRRYWTKGGVLRNVPVGGGCRKTKRSSKAKPEAAPAPDRERKSTSHSSSESSSLTATTTAAATEAVSAPSSQDSKLFISQITNPNFEAAPALLEQGSSGCGMFPEIGSFTSLISSTNETLPFGFGNISDVTPFNQYQNPQQYNQWHTQRVMNVSDEESKMQQITCSNNIGFGSLDWQTNGDHQALFDIPSAVDQAYWSQNQWTDQDPPNLYLP